MGTDLGGERRARGEASGDDDLHHRSLLPGSEGNLVGELGADLGGRLHRRRQRLELLLLLAGSTRHAGGTSIGLRLRFLFFGRPASHSCKF